MNIIRGRRPSSFDKGNHFVTLLTERHRRKNQKSPSKRPSNRQPGGHFSPFMNSSISFPFSTFQVVLQVERLPLPCQIQNASQNNTKIEIVAAALAARYRIIGFTLWNRYENYEFIIDHSSTCCSCAHFSWPVTSWPVSFFMSFCDSFATHFPTNFPTQFASISTNFQSNFSSISTHFSTNFQTHFCSIFKPIFRPNLRQFQPIFNPIFRQFRLIFQPIFRHIFVQFSNQLLIHF